MKSAQALEHTLKSLDGQKYGAYKRTKGMYEFDQFRLAIDHVQVDPFAPPSKMRVIMDRNTTGIPDGLLNDKYKRLAVSDFLTRSMHQHIQVATQKSKKSGKLFIDRCGQEMLERTSVVINDKDIEARIEVGLPAAGRKILGKAAAHTLDILPEIVNQALRYEHLDQTKLHNQVKLMIDQMFIRNELFQRGLVSFVANDAILPRQSGVSDRPMTHAIKFQSPEKFEIN